MARFITASRFGVTLVSAKAAYEKARVELDRSTGLLLENAGIVVEDAQRGQVTHMPKIPFVAPSKDVATGANARPETPSPAPQQQ